jgi:DNA-binding NtrC family response regulator
MRHGGVSSGSGPGSGAVAKKKVLLVDDCDELLSLMTCALLENGFDVAAAADAKQAYKMVMEGGFDLLITDIFMPDVNGSSLISMLRAAGFGAPVIVISGYVGCLEASRLRELGVARVLPKPFRIAALLRAIHQALDLHQGDDSPLASEDRLSTLTSS